MIDKIVIGSRIYDITLQEVPTADTTMNRKQLVNIEENNASAGGFVAPGANHQFQYNNHMPFQFQIDIFLNLD
jgi:hypothetical protein